MLLSPLVRLDGSVYCVEGEERKRKGGGGEGRHKARRLGDSSERHRLSMLCYRSAENDGDTFGADLYLGG